MAIYSARLCIALIGLWGLAASSVAGASDEAGWRPVDDLKALADAVPIAEGVDADRLDESWTITVEADGRREVRHRLLERINTRNAVEGHASIRWHWSPTYQEKPRLRARVVAPDGRVVEVDPAHMTESSVGEASPGVFVDSRALIGPVPALAPGALLEFEVVAVDRKPRGPARVWSLGPTQWGERSHRVAVTLDTHRSMDARADVRGLDAAIEVIREGDRVRRVIDVADWPDRDEDAPFAWLAPPGVGVAPHVVLSFGGGWRTVASWYGEHVDAAVAATSADTVEALVDGLAGQTPLAAARAIAERVHARVRYASVALGDGALFPRPAHEVWTSGYGDCKDLSTALVAALRALGHESWVALVEPSDRTPVDVEHPGVGAFDHAIAYVEADPPFWVDLTAPMVTPGELPASLHGRSALIARSRERRLRRLPASESGANTRREVRHIAYHHDGAGTVREVTTYTGAMAPTMRERAAGLDSPEACKWLEAYAKQTYGMKTPTACRLDAPPAGPVVLRFEGANGDETEWHNLRVELPRGPVFESFPQPMLQPRGADERPREAPLVWPVPHRAEHVLEIEPPPGFVLSEWPESKTHHLGGATLRVETLDRESTPRLRVALDTGPRLWRAEDVEAFRRGFAELPKVWGLEFVHEGFADLMAGRTRAAIEAYRASVGSWSDAPSSWARYGAVLLQLGFGHAAQSIGRRMHAAGIDHGDVVHLDCDAATRDPLGRPFYPGWNRPLALDRCAASYAQSPWHTDSLTLYVRALLTNPTGIVGGAGADWARAVEVMEAAKPDTHNDDTGSLLVAGLQRLDRFEASAKAPGLDAETRGKVEIVAAAVTQGVDAALDVAGTRITPLLSAGRMLNGLDRFDLTLALLDLGAARLPVHAAAIADFETATRSLLRRRVAARELTGPRGVVRRLMAAWCSGDADGEGARATLHPWVVDAVAPSLRDAAAATVIATRDNVVAGRSRRAAEWFAVARIDGEPITEDSGAYAVKLPALHAEARDEDFVGEAYVVRRRGGDYRIVAFSGSWASIAAAAGALVAHGKWRRARALLRWRLDSWDDFDLSRAYDVSVGQVSPRPALNASADEVTLAIALLPASGVVPARRFARDARRPIELRGLATAAWFEAATREGPAAEIAAARAAWAALPTELRQRRLGTFVDIQAALVDARIADAEAALSQLAEEAATLDDAELRKRIEFAVRFWRRQVAYHGDDPRALVEYVDTIYPADSSHARDHNESAWAHMMAGDPKRALPRAKRAVALSETPNQSVYHTLATIYAELDEPEAAREWLAKAVDLAGEWAPYDWYVIGRIEESIGATEAARHAYQQVEPWTYIETAADVVHLARRRLAALDAATPTPPP